MKCKEIRLLRCDDSLKIMMKKKCVFLTLTTPDVVDFIEIRERWRNLRHWLIRRLGKPDYVMNYEIHPKGHGWHIHCVITSYIDMTKYLKKMQSFGFGRINVELVTTRYVSDYLSKHCLKLYRGLKKYQRGGDFIRMRLVNQSRGLPPLSNYDYQSEYLNGFRKVMKIFKPKGIKPNTKLIADLMYYFGFSTYQESLEYFSELVGEKWREY